LYGNLKMVQLPSSSSYYYYYYYALQLWESFGLLNDDLPFGAILDMFCPLNNCSIAYAIKI
jgi:hypothetical protein